MGLHRVYDKVAAKMVASPPCKLMADYPRALVSRRIEVHLIQYKLFRLLGINHLHLFSATKKPKLLSALLTVRGLEEKKG
jgi:hypothetical protein